MTLSALLCFALYTDSANCRVRMLTVSTGLVSTLAGTSKGHADGLPLTAAKFNVPTAVCLDGSENVIVADSAANRIRMIKRFGKPLRVVCRVLCVWISAPASPALSAE